MTIAIASLLALFAIMLAGIPLAAALVLVAFVGLCALIGISPAIALLGQVTVDTGRSYELSVVPLFVLMGSFIVRAGIAEDLYDAANAWLGRFRGGLAMATIAACGVFSAMSGSSLATAATMTKVALPPMRRYGYAESLATATIAAGGTLGILIPPSVVMIIYGLLTETDIGELFIAGVIPGLLTIVGYIAAIWVATWINPSLGPAGARRSVGEMFRSLRRVWPVVVLIGVVLGGIYGGVFTPTESAGIGAFGALLFACLSRKMTFGVVLETLIDAAKISAMLFFVLIGALYFTALINLSGFAATVGDAVADLNLTPMELMLAICAIYVLLGMILESMSLIVLTIPVIFPLVQAAGIDPVWFGIMIVILVEVSMITPPVGLNLFVIRSMVPEVSIMTICRGLVPFYVIDAVRIIMFLMFPYLIMFLPIQMR